MKIVALLSWFDERSDWLDSMVRSLVKLQVNELVAVDGAYSLFPGAAARSPEDNQRALEGACADAGIAFQWYEPAGGPWPSEIVKRSFLFAMGERATTERDWYFVIDADTFVCHVRSDVRESLSSTALDVAAVRLVEPAPDGSQKQFRLPMFFRACRGLRVERNHYTYVTGDGRRLWGRGKTEQQLDLTEAMLCEHRTHLRDRERRQRAKRYYDQRDALGIELGTCELCPNPGSLELPTEWRPTSRGLTSLWITVCGQCAPKVREENGRVLRSYGLDPATVQVTFDRSVAA